MMKARLIKRHEAQEAIKRRHAKKKPKPPAVKKTVDAMLEWVEHHRAQRPDPRQAFTALFTQPQPQN